MPSKKNNLKKERKTVNTMIKMYCEKNHKPESNLCAECKELLEYANERLDYCKFGERKPACSNCSVHCYKPEMRENIREVMRFSGPRMIYRHPIMGIRHLYKKLKGSENDKEN